MAYIETYGTRKPRFSAHPLFPAIVALWFASLFGMGSFVLPDALVEHAIALTGIDALIPAAAPPLGMTARIAISTAFAVIGALLGFAIVRGISAAQAPAHPPRAERQLHVALKSNAGGTPRPILACEELGSASLDAPPEPARPQAAPRSEAENGLSGWQAEEHPMMPPMDVLTRKHAAMRREQPDPERPMPDESQAEPLDLANFEQATEQQADRQPATELAGLRNPSPTRREEPETTPPSETEIRFEQQGLEEEEPLAFAAPSQGEAVEQAAADEPLAFFAPSQARSERKPAPIETQPPESEAPALAADELPATGPEPHEPLERLSMIDLAERLAQSLDKRRGSLAPPPPELASALRRQLDAGAESSALAERPEEQAAADAADADQAEPQHGFDGSAGQDAPPPPVIPDELRPFPLDLEEFGEEEAELDLSLGLGNAEESDRPPHDDAQSAAAEPAGEPDDVDEEDESEDLAEAAGYSSLLAMKGSFRRPAEPVRIERPEAAEATAGPPDASPAQAGGEPAAGETPAHAPARRFDAPDPAAAKRGRGATMPGLDRDEAEQALRSALETLQRMSGAA